MYKYSQHSCRIFSFTPTLQLAAIESAQLSRKMEIPWLALEGYWLSQAFSCFCTAQSPKVLVLHLVCNRNCQNCHNSFCCKRIVGMRSVFRKVLVCVTNYVHSFSISKSMPDNCVLTVLSQLLMIFIIVYKASEKQLRKLIFLQILWNAKIMFLLESMML